MGNCSSVDCQQCYGEAKGCLKEIDVDSDIAGIGILIAFFLAAFLTCGTVFFAYSNDSLPDFLLSDTDYDMIRRFQTTYVSRCILPWIGRRWLGCKSLFYRTFGCEAPLQRPPILKEQRIAAVTRFILGFSDQLLATGLALLIATLANRCFITFFELRIVHSLAWAAVTTHIAALTVLREYLYYNPVVRNLRVFGIVVFFFLLCFFEVVTNFLSSAADSATPFQCIIIGLMGFVPVDILDFYSLLYFLYWYLSVTVLLYSKPSSLCTNLDITTSPILIASAYMHGRLPSKRRELVANTELQQDFLLRHVGEFHMRLSPGNLRIYRNSFLSFLPALLFGLVYGITKAIVAVWFSDTKITDDVRRVGFGQVCALALLAIPVLTASEIYNEARTTSIAQHKKNKYEDSEHTNSSSEENLSIPGTPGDRPTTPESAAPVDQSETTEIITTSQGQTVAPQHEPKTPDLIASQLSGPGLAQFIFRDIFSDIEQCPDSKLDQKRIAFASIALFHYINDNKSTARFSTLRRARQGLRQRLPLVQKSLFICHIATELFLAIVLSTPVPQELSFVVYALLVLIYGPDFWDVIREIMLRRKLIKKQLEILRNWSASPDDQQRMFEELLPDVMSTSASSESIRSGNSGDSRISSHIDDTEPVIAPARRQDTEANIGVIPRAR